MKSFRHGLFIAVGVTLLNTATAYAGDAECEVYAALAPFGVREFSTGRLLGYLRSTQVGDDRAGAELRLKSAIAVHVSGQATHVKVEMSEAMRQPLLACDGFAVFRLEVLRANVRLVKAAQQNSSSVTPRMEIDALETERLQRQLTRSELLRLKNLYWSVGDLERSQTLIKDIFSTP